MGGCRGYVVAGLTENKTKPSSWGLAELGNTTFHSICKLIRKTFVLALLCGHNNAYVEILERN